jgi:spermidine synthase
VAFLLLGAFLLRGKLRILAPVVILALVAYTEVSAKAAPAELVLERESPYQLIRVFKDGARRYLTINEGAGVQSVYDPAGGRLGMYYDYFGLVPLVRPAGDGGQDIAVIGLAGGTAVRQYASIRKGDYRFTGVEVDPQVIGVAREQFGLDELGIDVVNEDGRMFLSSTDKRFDVIVVDAYSVQLYIPAHLATEEFFRLVKSRLKSGGVLVMNVNAPHDDSPLLRALGNAVAAAFSDVRVVPLPEAWNRILFASDEPVDFDAVSRSLPADFADMRDVLAGAYRVTRDPSAQSFTDDRAPVEFLTDAMIVGEAARRR